MSVTVLPYSSAWPVRFREEAARIEIALAPWLVGGVLHIGSTSVPGLAAKPIIDMIAGVGDLRQAQQAVPVLAELGYEPGDHRPHEALWFSRDGSGQPGTRTHQLHLTRPDSALWLERLTFRDALRADARLLEDYQALKRRLAASSEDLADYTPGKRQFVSAVLERAGVSLA